MTQPTLVIQTIKTIWSKAARGGASARLRNAVPEALPLPLPHAAEHVSSVQHYAQFLEHTRWETPTEHVIVNTLLHPLVVGCVTIENRSDYVWVTYQYRRECGGAPERRYEQKTLVATTQQWAQVIWNGRFAPAWEGEWWYEKTVVNVGLFHSVTSNVFTHSSPVASYQSLQQIRSYPG